MTAKDFRPLHKVGAALGSEWRGGIVVTRGTQIMRLDETGNTWSVPVHRLLA